MSEILRILTREGTSKFREYLRELKSNPFADIPEFLLNDPVMSAEFPEICEVSRQDFSTKLELAKAVDRALGDVVLNDLDAELVEGMWNWLSLFHFEVLCPMKKDKGRIPGEENRFLLNRSWNRRSRHLAESSFNAFKMHGEVAEVLLSSAPSVGSELVAQLSGRQQWWTNKGLIMFVHRLYWDSEEAKLKPGITTRTKPGTIIRLDAVMKQLDRTYDLYSMSANDFLTVAPPEFDRWLD